MPYAIQSTRRALSPVSGLSSTYSRLIPKFDGAAGIYNRVPSTTTYIVAGSLALSENPISDTRASRDNFPLKSLFSKEIGGVENDIISV